MSRLSTKQFADWLRPHITSGARVIPGRLPDVPNRVIGITKGSGPGMVMDGLFEVLGLIVVCRGGENNLDDAESIAGEVDDIMTGRHDTLLSENFLIPDPDGNVKKDVWVSDMGRTGGEPIQLSITDSVSRWSFTCSYYLNVSTNVGQVFNGN